MIHLKTLTTEVPAVLREEVRKATCSTLAPILGSEVTLLEDGGEFPCGPVIIGLISFMGDHSWTCAYILPQGTAEAVAQKFVGFEIPFHSPDMADVVGELANVIAGDITAHLDRRRIKVQMSLPSVSRGDHMEVLIPAGLPTTQMSFNAREGPFWCSVVCAPPRSLNRWPGG